MSYADDNGISDYIMWDVPKTYNKAPMKTEIEKAMDLKQKRIAHFQDAKERSMAIMSSGRDATMIVAQLMAQGSLTTYEEKETESGTVKIPVSMETERVESELKKWRKFFFYEIYGTDPDEEIKQNLKETLPPNTILGF